MPNKERKWICTDPDRGQYGLKLSKEEAISNWAYQFKEGEELLLIDLEDYTTQQMADAICAYGYSLNPTSNTYIFNIYHDQETVCWIIAECIFEQESGLY